MAAWDDSPAAGGLGECSALVRSAEALRFSAPELAVQLARRALSVLADASGSDGVDHGDGRALVLAMRARAVLAAGLVRVSHYIDAVEPAFAALTLAEGEGMAELATSVRLDLAACAREVGEPLLGCALLRPVLEAAQSEPSVRATALARLVGCTAHVGRRDDVEDALAEADRLLASDEALSPDARRMERARLSVRTAAYHRWYGDTEDAAEAAREGLGQLNRLRGGRPETARLRAQLVLELVSALLDEGDLGEAEAASLPLLDEPVRATSAAAVGQLMLAVSTRIHLPRGRVERGRGLLDQAVWVAERHGLDNLLAETLTVVSQLDERAGHTTDALEWLRTARAAEQRRLRASARAARRVLTEVGSPAEWDVSAASALLRQVVQRVTQPVAPAMAPVQALPTPAVVERPPETDGVTGLLNSAGLVRRLSTVRNGERPVALTLVRLAEAGERAGANGVNLVELARRVRDLAPAHAELARSDGTELAVLLPHTTRDQAEEFAKSLRETAIESNWLATANARSITTGVVQSNPDAASVDANALLNAARDALSKAEPVRHPSDRTQPVDVTALTAQALADLQDVGDTLRIGRSIISSLSIPEGSGGRRRAETGTFPKLSSSGDGQPTPAGTTHPPTGSPRPPAPSDSPHSPAPSTPPGSPTAPRHATPAHGMPALDPSSPPPAPSSTDSGAISANSSFAGSPAGGGSPSERSGQWPQPPSSQPSHASQTPAEPTDAHAPDTREAGTPSPAQPVPGTEGSTPGQHQPSRARHSSSGVFPVPGTSWPPDTSRQDPPTPPLGFAGFTGTDAPGFRASRGSDAPAAHTADHGAAADNPTGQPTTGSPTSTPAAPGTAADAFGDFGPGASGSGLTTELADAHGSDPGTAGAGSPTPGLASSPRPHPADTRASGAGEGGTAGFPTPGSAPFSSERSDTALPASGAPEPTAAAGEAYPPPVSSPREAAAVEAVEEGYRSSYEETRAELARLMSALEAGAPDAPVEPRSPAVTPESSGGDTAAEPSRGEPASSGRWSFPAPGTPVALPAPARPGDDQTPRYGLALSVPAPPEPSEVPEPPSPAEVPEPPPPEPVPTPPNDPGAWPPGEPGSRPPGEPGSPPPGEPGPPPPGEPGSQPPGDPTVVPHLGAYPGTTGQEAPFGEPVDPPTPSPRPRRRGERSSTAIAGLLADALAAYQETARDDHDAQPPTPSAEADLASFDRLLDWPYQPPASGRHRSPE
ncbi:diguanylate cyclase domain-containing protein [Actinophytocola xanthii]|uniref:diguanylate cyclase domain-containing protein n=1 Tax=Actinophytocola xanthii TaxID=1912961 RepID=UPI001178875F|nr:diguanylate cyclase [Actinophytocola xanthii]